MKRLLCFTSILVFPFLASTQTTLQKVLNSIKNGSKSQTQTTNNSNQARNFPLSVGSNGQKVGDVAPDAVYIDADRFSGFNGGAAIIYKGSAAALIDAKGKVIVGYNTYENIGIVATQSQSSKPQEINLGEVPSFSTGFFTAGFPNTVVLNAKGKIIANGNPSKGAVNNGKYLQIGMSFYDINGTKFSPLKQYEGVIDVNDDIILKMKPGNSSNEKSHYSYCKITGEAITSDDFDEAYRFSDGMALVGKKDEFGQIKYGYIDKTGKLAIPLKFSIKPGDFINGIAQVYPKDNSQFQYAFINKKGDVVMQVSSNDAGMKLSSFGNDTYIWRGWFIVNGLYVMDSSRKIFTMSEFLNKNGIKSECAQMMLPQQKGSGAFLFLAQRFGNNQGFGNGALNLEKGFIINPIFSNQLYFDPVSKLAYAKMVIDKGNGEAHYREGYVNEYGVFVIVKKEQSQF